MGKLTVGKIVATSTEQAWSQAYHAGGFTAVLSLTSKDPHNPVTETELHKTGKEILDTLIAEYFTLTTKDLETVKAAAQTTVEKVPEGYHLSLVVGAVVKNVLYLVIANAGKALLKRGEKTGTLLQMEDADNEQSLESVSGYLEQNDIIILQTEQFRKVLPEHELVASLDHHSPIELAEMMAPKIHEAQNGGASALLFEFQEETRSSLLAPSHEDEKEEEKPHAPTFFAKDTHDEDAEETAHQEVAEEEEKEEPEEEKDEERNEEKHEEKREIPSPFPTLPAEKKRGFSLSHMQKMFLTVAVILAGVLMASIILYTNRQKQQQQAQLFQSIYNPAKEKYSEGQSLVEMNPTLAISDFQTAKDMLSGAQGKFPQGSSDAQQISTLLSQVENSLSQASQANSTQLTKAADTASPLLAFQLKQQTTYVAEDATNFYAADSNGITQTNKKTSATKQVVKNNGDYASLGGFGTYLGNLYVLDRRGGIYKYAAGSFARSEYFSTSENPNLTKAVSVAIDGSIWVLSSDGTIKDYLRGRSVAFSVTGLTKPLSSPSSIFTTADDANLYILDNGNSRLVEISKKGTFVAEYDSTLLKNATGLDVDEANKTAYILSGNTIYQLSL